MKIKRRIGFFIGSMALLAAMGCAAKQAASTSDTSTASTTAALLTNMPASYRLDLPKSIFGGTTSSAAPQRADLKNESEQSDGYIELKDGVTDIKDVVKEMDKNFAVLDSVYSTITDGSKVGVCQTGISVVMSAEMINGMKGSMKEYQKQTEVDDEEKSMPKAGESKALAPFIYEAGVDGYDNTITFYTDKDGKNGTDCTATKNIVVFRWMKKDATEKKVMVIHERKASETKGADTLTVLKRKTMTYSDTDKRMSIVKTEKKATTPTAGNDDSDKTKSITMEQCDKVVVDSTHCTRLSMTETMNRTGKEAKDFSLTVQGKIDDNGGFIETVEKETVAKTENGTVKIEAEKKAVQETFGPTGDLTGQSTGAFNADGTITWTVVVALDAKYGGTEYSEDKETKTAKILLSDTLNRSAVATSVSTAAPGVTLAIVKSSKDISKIEDDDIIGTGTYTYDATPGPGQDYRIEFYKDKSTFDAGIKILLVTLDSDGNPVYSDVTADFGTLTFQDSK